MRMPALGFRATPATLATGVLALSGLWYPWRELLPTWSLRFDGARVGFYGRTLWPDRVIEIYVRPTQDLADVAFALAHEVGHAVDLEHLDSGQRARWKAARGVPATTPWFGPSDAEDFDTPAGDWAECFAAWQVGPCSFHSRVGGVPTEAELHLLSALALAPLSAGDAASSPASESSTTGRFPHSWAQGPAFVAR